MANALIFSASFEGHRQVYVFVLAQELNKLGYKIFIAGNYSAKLSNAYYIDKLTTNYEITKIDTSSLKGGGLGISNFELVEIQKINQIDLTVFAEADNHIPLINSQLFSKHKKFRGITIGIFLRPFYFYQRLDVIGILRYLKRLISTWRSDQRLFHEVLNTYFRILDKSLHIDDYFVSKHKKTLWLPDVFQQYADRLVMEEQTEQRVWIEKLNEFKDQNKGCFLLLYFGTAQKRRGYDKLLKLAVDNNACFVHCGLRNDGEKYEFDIEELRNTLKNNKKLFETNEFITDPRIIEYFFKSVSHLILPYNNFYGSSGVMLQALGYNIPVLVPDIGIMGYRTKKYNLGLTYESRSNSLDAQFKQFKEIPVESFSGSILKYMGSQSVIQLERILSKVFSACKVTTEQPLTE